MSCSHRQCCTKRRAVVSPSNSLASVIYLTPFIAKGCGIFAWWEHPGAAGEWWGAFVPWCCCALGLRDTNSGVCLWAFSSTGTHTHTHLSAPAEIHPETQGSAQCLLPGALGCLGAEAEQNRAVPQHKSHCTCPSLKWRKQHWTMCSHLTNLIWHFSACCGAAPPCWQGFCLNFKPEKWKEGEAQILVASCLCWQIPSLTEPLSYIPSSA